MDDVHVRDALGKSNVKEDRKSPKTDRYDDDDFEEIDEDLPDETDLAGIGGEVDAQGRPSAPKIGGSHGITVSQSLGIDPSVDSL